MSLRCPVSLLLPSLLSLFLLPSILPCDAAAAAAAARPARFAPRTAPRREISSDLRVLVSDDARNGTVATTLRSLSLSLSARADADADAWSPSSGKRVFMDAATFGEVRRGFKNAAIVGGDRATDNMVLHLAVLLIRAGGRTFVCSASIVSATRVLTAAHCFYDRRTTSADGLTQVFVLPAQLKRRVMGPVYVARYVDVIASYNAPTLQNDVAVVEINGEFDAGEVKTVELPRQRERTPTGDVATAAGYGRVRNDARLAKVLRSVDLRISTVRRCRRRFNPAIWDTIVRREVICATSTDADGRGSQSICGGDSGGPFFYRRPSGRLLQIGIASFNEELCSSPGATSWFTNLKTYSNEVRQLLRGNRSSWNRLFTFEL